MTTESTQPLAVRVEPSVRPDAERAAFERWVDTERPSLHAAVRTYDETMAMAHVMDAAWLAWKAARVDLVAALQWYADGLHFDKASPDAWDTVSGEPQNWWCDEAGTATVEDGSIAAMTLRGELTAAQIQALD